MKFHSGPKNLNMNVGNKWYRGRHILCILGLSYIGCSMSYGIVRSSMEMVKNKKEYLKVGHDYFMITTVFNTMVYAFFMPFYIPIILIGKVGGILLLNNNFFIL